MSKVEGNMLKFEGSKTSSNESNSKMILKSD